MEFKREFQMVVPVEHWLKRQGLMVKREFLLPWGVCDLVAVSFSPRNVKRRLKLRQHEPIGPLSRVQLLDQIPDADSGTAISEADLGALCDGWSSTRSFEMDLQKLFRNRFVIRTNDGLLQKLNGWYPLQKRLVAVEMKLFRVLEALEQAASHLSFATESYVALPANISENVVRGNRLSDFKSAGVGLLSVGMKNCRMVLRSSPPATASIDSPLQMHCAERFWRTRDS